MKLKPKERGAILAGDHPEIVRTGTTCPFTVGEQVVLRAQKTHGTPASLVSITIIGYDRLKSGAWEAEYSVRDDRGLYLARSSGYTRSAADSIDHEAGVEDQATLKRYAAQGRLRQSQHAEDRRTRERAIRDRLREALKGLPPEGQVMLLAGIEREIQQAQSRAAA